jgi:hypothetical protein
MNNTIFDDVFRTMIEKMLYLAVPLINEVFHTSYPEDVKIADYIFRKEEDVRKGIGDIMGGKVLELESERLKAEGMIAGASDMLPPLKSLILKWGLLAQWLY